MGLGSQSIRSPSLRSARMGSFNFSWSEPLWLIVFRVCGRPNSVQSLGIEPRQHRRPKGQRTGLLSFAKE